jgi:hypothetical protein
VVPRVRNLLDRFRPAGAPGAATSAGVPADRRASAVRELEPIFAELGPVVRQCATIRREATAAAADHVAQSAERARTLIARAQREGEAERAATASALRAQAEDAARQRVAEAEDEAVDVRRVAEARRPELLHRVLERVWADLMDVVGAPDGIGVDRTTTRPSPPGSSP